MPTAFKGFAVSEFDGLTPVSMFHVYANDLRPFQTTSNKKHQSSIVNPKS